MLKLIILLFYLFIVGCNYDEDSSDNEEIIYDDEQLNNCMDYIDYNQSSRSAFYAFQFIKLNGIAIEDDDWVGAFNGDVCVGFRQWDTSKCGAGVCEVPAMGFDSFTPVVTQGYCESGDVPTFKIYDASEDKIHDAYIKNSLGMIMDVNPWQNIAIFVVSDTLIGILGTEMDCSD